MEPAVEPRIQAPQDRLAGVQPVLGGPVPQVAVPWFPGSGPSLLVPVQPAWFGPWGGGCQPGEGPLGGGLVELLPGPLNDHQHAAGHQQRLELVQGRIQLCYVVQ
jgi:hypothetical protein